MPALRLPAVSLSNRSNGWDAMRATVARFLVPPVVPFSGTEGGRGRSPEPGMECRVVVAKAVTVV